jgi:Flp pilus assembly protein TadG
MALRRFLRDTRAAAASELALVLPAIAFIILNVVDLGNYIYTRMQVDLAAHEAVGAARVLCDEDTKLPAKTNCGGSLDSTMTSAAQSTSLGNSVTLGASEEAWFCADASGDLVQVAPLGGTVPADCSATVAGSTAEPGDYIRVTASHSFSPIFPGASVAAVLPATITREGWMRLQ